MSNLSSQNPATGGPGIEPRWSRSDKDGVGTAYSSLSRVWFTISRGVLNEVYYPTIDHPQIRDMQYLITDGETFFHDERRHLQSTHEYIADYALGFRITNSDPEGRYHIHKEVIADPHRACVLIRTRLEADPKLLPRLKLFVLLAPHLGVGGAHNNGYVVKTAWGNVVAANKNDTWLALSPTVPFLHCSCGYVGSTDGWQDLAHDYRMDWQFDAALDGNIALTGEIDIQKVPEFVLALSFGTSLHQALMNLSHSLSFPFEENRARFIEQWSRASDHFERNIERRREMSATKLREEGPITGDEGRLFRNSCSILLAHEDKAYEGALIASLSIPWGEAKSDDDLGGYHLVWTRDMCNSATGLMAAGDTITPLRALVYLALTQRPDGGFYQNFWINGEAYWHGIQLDEVAFPIVLAWRLREAKALRDFYPWPMVRRAASYLIHQGPATPEERWEENSGYSPSTLAAHIAGLICAASFARERGHEETARFLEEYADFLECHIESWLVTTDGALVPGIKRHFIRINPVDVNDPQADEDPNRGILTVRNRPPGAVTDFPAKDVVDGGFLELVRYGILKAGSPLLEDSLRVLDAVLKVDTPFGPCWHRYNHDGYGQKEDGGPFDGWGRGQAWPLLTGERGHYELAAGRDVLPYIRAMEGFATKTALLPEQIWDEPDRPDIFMYLGQPTGGAMPLCWAHAEYIKLVRSAFDGKVFDLIPAVAERYGKRVGVKPLEVWKPNRQVGAVKAGWMLRIISPTPFQLHWTMNEWQQVNDTPSTSTLIGAEFVDLPVPVGQQAPIRFTFFWTGENRWEGKDYQVVAIK